MELAVVLVINTFLATAFVFLLSAFSYCASSLSGSLVKNSIRLAGVVFDGMASR